MKRISTSAQNKAKSRSINRSASAGLIEYINRKFGPKMPVAALTSAHKMFGRSKPLTKDDKFIARFSDQPGFINATKLVEYLGQNETHEKGKMLSDEAVKRVY